MPGIKRLQPGYSSVGIVDFHKDEDGEDKPRPQYFIRCNDLFGIYSVLGQGLIHLTKIQVNQCQSLQTMIIGSNVWAVELFTQNTK